jgi:hypothetical protein
MTAATPVLDEHKAMRCQAWLLALVVVILAATLAAAQWIANHDGFLLRHRLAEWKQTNGLYNDGRIYPSPEARLLNEILPHADYSRGGAYLIGASAAETEAQFWALPPEQQALIHNYCIASATYTQQFQFIRYLVEHEGLLRAGGEKTCIVVGLSFHMAAHSVTLDPNGLFHGFFGLNGLYSYDLAHGVQPVTMPSALREFRIRQYRNHAFWTWAGKSAFARDFDYMWLNDRLVATARARAREGGAPDPGWEAGIDAEAEQLDEMIDYLRARNVAVHGIYLPEATWMRGIPPIERHREKVLAVLSTKAVPIADIVGMAPDTDFSDSVHLSYTGVQKVSPVIWEIARAHLRRVGLLPAPPGQ